MSIISPCRGEFKLPTKEDATEIAVACSRRDTCMRYQAHRVNSNLTSALYLDTEECIDLEYDSYLPEQHSGHIHDETDAMHREGGKE